MKVEEKPFTLRIPADLHKELKMYVIMEDTTMKDYIIKLIRDDMERVHRKTN